MLLEKSLSDLSLGEQAIIKRLDCDGAIRRRLLDLGFISGTPVECVGISPGGDPAAYLIRSAVIAIRSADGQSIAVKPN